MVYRCNHLFYRSLHRAAAERLPTRAGFIHLPLLPEQAARQPGLPCLTPDLMIEAVQLIVRKVAETPPNAG